MSVLVVVGLIAGLFVCILWASPPGDASPIPPDRLAGRPAGSAPPIVQLAAQGKTPTVLGAEYRLDNGAMFLPGGVVRTSDGANERRAGEEFFLADSPYVLSGEAGVNEIHVQDKATGTSHWFVWDDATGWSRWDHRSTIPQLASAEATKEPPKRVPRTAQRLQYAPKDPNLSVEVCDLDDIKLYSNGTVNLAGTIFDATYQQIDVTLPGRRRFTRANGAKKVTWLTQDDVTVTGFFYISAWTAIRAFRGWEDTWYQLVPDGRPSAEAKLPEEDLSPQNRFFDIVCDPDYRWRFFLIGVIPLLPLFPVLPMAWWGLVAIVCEIVDKFYITKKDLYWFEEDLHRP